MSVEEEKVTDVGIEKKQVNKACKRKKIKKK
jgi:hypothetical protein